MSEQKTWQQQIVQNTISLLLAGLLMGAGGILVWIARTQIDLLQDNREIKTELGAERKAQDALIKIYLEDLDRLQQRVKELENRVLLEHRVPMEAELPSTRKPTQRYDDVKNRLDKSSFQYIQSKK